MFYKFAWYYGVITIIIDLAITTFCPVPESDYEYIAKNIKNGKNHEDNYATSKARRWGTDGLSKRKLFMMI